MPRSSWQTLSCRALGDVAAGGLDLDGVTVVVLDREALPRDPPLPLRGLDAHVGSAAVRRQIDRRQQVEKSAAMLGLDERQPRPPEQLLARAPDRLAVRVVHERELQRRVEAGDEIVMRLDEAAVAQLARAQRLLGELALGDVLDLRDEVPRLAVHVADERRAEETPDGVAALVPVALLEMVRLRATVECRARALDRRRDVVRMRQHLESLLEHLGFVVAHHVAERAVHLRDPSVSADEDDAGGRRVERGPEALLALAQCPRRVHAIGHVAGDAAHAEDRAARTPDRGGERLDPARAVRRAHGERQERNARPGGDRPKRRLEVGALGLRDDEVVKAAADDRQDGRADEGRHRLVHVRQPAAQIAGVDEVARVLREIAIGVARLRELAPPFELRDAEPDPARECTCRPLGNRQRHHRADQDSGSER